MKLLKKSGAILLALSMLCVPTMAHQGRTDSSGGHKDNKNASGLGSYHYHCGGYPAHLHENGVCPYAGSSKTSSSSSSNSSSSSSNPSKSTSSKSTPTYNEKSVKFVIDGNATTIKGITVDNTNLVELKTLCDKLGISINYDSANKTITGGKNGKSFKLTIGNKGATINGSYVTMSVAPITYNGRTMVPARVIAEAIGKAVTYDESTNTIHIGSTATSVPTSTTYTRDDENIVYLNDLAEQEVIDRTVFRDVTENDYKWISGMKFGKVTVHKSKIDDNIKATKNPYMIGDYVDVYSFYEDSLTNMDLTYIVDDMTDEFMNAQNATGTFNGIKMKKENGTLWFDYQDLASRKLV